MLVRLVTKYDVPVYQYTLDESSTEKNHRRIPDLGDHVEVDNERYQVVDRTFILAKDEVILQLWKPILDDPDYEEDSL